MSRPRTGLRVIAGTAGGRRLETPPGLGTRPITDRVKESLFASLGPAVLEGARVLDLYAGSGAMAIEALSRGAVAAVLVERDARAAEVARRNVEATGFADRAEVRRSDVRRFLQGRPFAPPFDLVFCDPPYDVASGVVEADLRALVPWVSDDALVVIRRRAQDGAPRLPGGWRFLRERVFGDTLVAVATVAAETSRSL